MVEDSGMARRMRDKDFRDDQWARRYTGKVERINRFIDELGAKDDAGHPPYIAPTCGGVDALALSTDGPQAARCRSRPGGWLTCWTLVVVTCLKTHGPTG
jgi:hypothetical protein